MPASPQQTLSDLLALTQELQIDLARPHLYQQFISSQKAYLHALHKRRVLFALVFLACIAGTAYLGVISAHKEDKAHDKYKAIGQFCDDNGGSAKKSSDGACHARYKKNVKHNPTEWNNLITKCCGTGNSTLLCEDTLPQMINDFCSYYPPIETLLFVFSVMGCVSIFLTSLCYSVPQYHDDGEFFFRHWYTPISESHNNDPQVYLNPDRTQQLETIIKDIRDIDINMAGSSLQQDPASKQRAKLIAAVSKVTLVPHAGNTISAQKIKVIYWALEELVKMSSGVKQVVAGRYNVQNDILDRNEEAGAGANMSYQHG